MKGGEKRTRNPRVGLSRSDIAKVIKAVERNNRAKRLGKRVYKAAYKLESKPMEPLELYTLDADAPFGLSYKGKPSIPKNHQDG